MKTTKPAVTAEDLAALPVLRDGPNGAAILMERPLSPYAADAHLRVVLARQSKSWGVEFVTWEFNSQRDDYYWGHYFMGAPSANDAYLDFEGRGKPGYKA